MYIIKKVIYSAMQYKFCQIMNPDFATEVRHLQYRSFKSCGFQCIRTCMWKIEKHFNYDKFHFHIFKYITCCIILSLRFVFTGIQTSSQLRRVYKWHRECFRLKLLYPWRVIGTWHLGRTLIYIWRYRVTWGYLLFVSCGERRLLEFILTISVPLHIFGSCSSL